MRILAAHPKARERAIAGFRALGPELRRRTGEHGARSCRRVNLDLAHEKGRLFHRDSLGSKRAVSRWEASQEAVSEATSCASLFRIVPSSSVFSAFAASVAPVVVMSTMISAVPEAGAPSVAPALSTMR